MPAGARPWLLSATKKLLGREFGLDVSKSPSTMTTCELKSVVAPQSTWNKIAFRFPFGEDVCSKTVVAQRSGRLLNNAAQPPKAAISPPASQSSNFFQVDIPVPAICILKESYRIPIGRSWPIPVAAKVSRGGTAVVCLLRALRTWGGEIVRNPTRASRGCR